MSMSQLIDLSKLTRRPVDMSVLPDHSKTLQQRIYEEAAKRLKGRQGSAYKGLSLVSEYNENSYEQSFEERVEAIVTNTINGRGTITDVQI